MSAHNLIEEEEEELAIGTVIFTAGDAKADYWDDSELIDHWDKTVEAYRKQCLDQSEHLVTDPPYHQKKMSHKTKQGHITKSKPAPRKNIQSTSHSALRKGTHTNTFAKAKEQHAPPHLPAMPTGSDNQEDLSNLMMAWYYCGYYTGLYQGQHQQ
ncbi:unnamed protein product [Mucor circinelloides]